jgi:hypothetical protein
VRSSHSAAVPLLQRRSPHAAAASHITHHVALSAVASVESTLSARTIKNAFGSARSSAGGTSTARGRKTSESGQIEKRDAMHHLTIEGYALAIAGVAYAVSYNVSGDDTLVAVCLTGVAYGISRWQTRNL